MLLKNHEWKQMKIFCNYHLLFWHGNVSEYHSNRKKETKKWFLKREKKKSWTNCTWSYKRWELFQGNAITKVTGSVAKASLKIFTIFGALIPGTQK